MFFEVEDAISQLQSGRMLIVTDDEQRENEGDLIVPAETVTAEQVNFIVTWARGLLCAAADDETAGRLRLHPMAHGNTALHQTQFTVSVDAREGTTTGVSARDRAATLQRLASPDARPEDFARPGHVFPIVARSLGVLERAGHTEAAVDLARLAGRAPVGALCEILDPMGNSARLPYLQWFARKHGLGILTIEKLIQYQKRRVRLVEKVVSLPFPTKFGEFELRLYNGRLDGKEHIALVKGNVRTPEPVLARVHDQCLTGDLFGSLRCDCGPQFRHALRTIEAEGRGVLLYLAQEGRGIGLANKLKAYTLQEQGLDTVDANLRLGRKADERDYAVAAQILTDLGIQKIRLMTNNPLKIHGLSENGIEVVESLPLWVGENPRNQRYLRTKREKMGHLPSRLEPVLVNSR